MVTDIFNNRFCSLCKRFFIFFSYFFFFFTSSCINKFSFLYAFLLLLFLSSFCSSNQFIILYIAKRFLSLHLFILLLFLRFLLSRRTREKVIFNFVISFFFGGGKFSIVTKKRTYNHDCFSNYNREFTYFWIVSSRHYDNRRIIK